MCSVRLYMCYVVSVCVCVLMCVSVLCVVPVYMCNVCVCLS